MSTARLHGWLGLGIVLAFLALALWGLGLRVLGVAVHTGRLGVGLGMGLRAGLWTKAPASGTEPRPIDRPAMTATAAANLTNIRIIQFSLPSQDS